MTSNAIYSRSTPPPPGVHPVAFLRRFALPRRVRCRGAVVPRSVSTWGSGAPAHPFELRPALAVLAIGSSRLAGERADPRGSSSGSGRRRRRRVCRPAARPPSSRVWSISCVAALVHPFERDRVLAGLLPAALAGFQVLAHACDRWATAAAIGSCSSETQRSGKPMLGGSRTPRASTARMSSRERPHSERIRTMISASSGRGFAFRPAHWLSPSFE